MGVVDGHANAGKLILWEWSPGEARPRRQYQAYPSNSTVERHPTWPPPPPSVLTTDCGSTRPTLLRRKLAARPPVQVKPINRKIETIANMKPTTPQMEVRKFIGVINYYRDMWPRRSHTLVPLTRLTSLLYVTALATYCGNSLLHL